MSVYCKSFGGNGALSSGNHCKDNNPVTLSCIIKPLQLIWSSATGVRSLNDVLWLNLKIGYRCINRIHVRGCAIPHGPLARYVKLRVAYAPGMPGTFSPPPWVREPDMHHGTCVPHVSWCMPGSLTSGLLWSRWRGKRSRHSRRMRNPQFYVSGKRPIYREYQASIVLYYNTLPSTVYRLNILSTFHQKSFQYEDPHSRYWVLGVFDVNIRRFHDRRILSMGFHMLIWRSLYTEIANAHSSSPPCTDCGRYSMCYVVATISTNQHKQVLMRWPIQHQKIKVQISNWSAHQK